LNRSVWADGGVLNGEAPVHVRVEFDDGLQRLVTVTQEEALHLKDAGIDVSTPSARLGRWWRDHAWKLTKTVSKVIVPALIGGVLITAATRQWSDRREELEMKNDLIMQISEDSSTAYTSGLKVVHAGDRDSARLRESARFEWIEAEGHLDPTIYLFFRDREDPTNQEVVATHWGRYRQVVYLYLLVSCCDSDRKEHLGEIRTYLKKTEPRLTSPERDIAWDVLEKDPKEMASLATYRDAYEALGLGILTRRGLLLDDLMESDAKGFSNDPADFGRDVRDAFTSFGGLLSPPDEKSDS